MNDLLAAKIATTGEIFNATRACWQQASRTLNGNTFISELRMSRPSWSAGSFNYLSLAHRTKQPCTWHPNTANKNDSGIAAREPH